MKSSSMQYIYDADEMLQQAIVRHKIDLGTLVAETALWASSEVHRLLLDENGTGTFYPGRRRYRSGKGELPGSIVDAEMLDRNNYANQAIKKAIGIPRQQLVGFEACHIWPSSCYDVRYHTAIANLVLLPRALAGLSDHCIEISQLLQYRSFEIYNWHPVEQPEPTKPDNYPTNWREPHECTLQVMNAIRRRKPRPSSVIDA